MENVSLKQQQSDKLIFYGILLFLLGLLVGLIVPILANPRMALSSHIEGVLNGMFLVLMGLIWNKLNLSEKQLKLTMVLGIYGTFANWLGILIAAIFNAGANLNIAANGRAGDPIIDGIVNFLLVSLSISMIIICVLILIGLKKK